MMKKLLALTFLSFFLSLYAMSQCGQVSLIGEFNGWVDDVMMMRSLDNPDEFSVFVTFTLADDLENEDSIIHMKFRENKDWAVNWGAEDFPSGTAEADGANIPVPPGSYFVTFNCSTGAYNFESHCGVVSMIGEFNGWSDDFPMMRDPMDINKWVTYITFSAANDVDPLDDSVDCKFRANADWTVNWGSSDFPTGTAVQDGPNIRAPFGNYKVEFDCSTGEYTFTPTTGEVSMIGEFNGWAADYPMHRDPMDPWKWTTILNLDNETADASDPADGIIEMKFRQNADWSVNWGGDTYPEDTAFQNGPNIPVPMDEEGLTSDFFVTFEVSQVSPTTGNYVFEPTSGHISMIGAFNGWNGDVPMHRDPDNPHLWKLTRSWHSDSEVKFRENMDWTVNWGAADWPSGTGEDNGPNIPLEAGTYDVTFNYETKEYTFTENTDVCGEIGMVGDFNNWGTPETAGDPETDVYLVRDPMHPTQFSLEYNFTGSTNMLFRVDALPITNDNVWGGTFPSGTGVQDVTQLIAVPGGKYHITFNCESGDFNFERLGSAVEAPKVFAINVDGVLNESDWNITQPAAGVIEGTPGDPVNEVFFGLAYNETHLFMGVKVMDAAIASGDLVELFLDGNKSGGDYDDSDFHFTVTHDGTVAVVQGPSGLAPTAEVSTITGGYTVEASVAWTDLGVTPTEGAQLSFDVFAQDESGYTLGWNGSTNNYTSTSDLGDLILGTLSCGVVSIYSELIDDVGLQNPTDMPTTYVGTYDFLEAFDVVFRKDGSSTVSWGDAAFPSGTATVGGDVIPVPVGRYRISFDCLTGAYSFTDEAADEGVAYADYTETAEEVDGDLSAYDLAYGSELEVAKLEINNTVSWGAMWDADYLYFGAQVVDDVVEGSGNPWENDAIEMYIDGNHDEDETYDGDFDTQLIMDYFSNTDGADGVNDMWLKADGVQFDTTQYMSKWLATDDGYNVEVKLMWSIFGFEPGKGRSIGWSIGNNDSDNGTGRDYQSVWYGTGSNWSNTADLGDLQLDGGPYYVVGIDEVPVQMNDNTFVLYPNPSSGQVFIRSLDNNIDGDVHITIADITGRIVQHETLQNVNSSIAVQLNTDNLTTGMYLISIVNKGSRVSKKLVIR